MLQHVAHGLPPCFGGLNAFNRTRHLCTVTADWTIVHQCRCYLAANDVRSHCTLTRKESEWDRPRRVWCRYPKNDYREHKNYCSESNCVRQDTGGISWLELIYWRQFIWASLPAYDRNNTLNVIYVFAEQEHSIEFIVYVKSFRINTRLLQLVTNTRLANCDLCVSGSTHVTERHI
jgi:hypothetical protein